MVQSFTMADVTTGNIGKYSFELDKTFQTMRKLCPERMSRILAVFSTKNSGYTQGTIADQEALSDILVGMEASLVDIRDTFKDWELARKNAIVHLRVVADDLDSVRQSTNYRKLAGSAISILSSALGLASVAFSAPTGWLSLRLGSVGSYIGVWAGVNFMSVDCRSKSKAKHFVKTDEELSRMLAEKLKDLDQHIGRLGHWDDTPCVCDTLAEASRAFVPQATGSLTEYCVTTGMENAAKIGGVVQETGITCLNALAVVIDVTVIGYVVKDLHSGSKTATAEQFREAARKLENELTEMRKIYKKIKDDGKMREFKIEIAKQNEEIARHMKEHARQDKEIIKQKEESERVNKEIIRQKKESERKNEQIIRMKSECEKMNEEIAKLKQWGFFSLLFLFLFFVFCIIFYCCVVNHHTAASFDKSDGHILRTCVDNSCMSSSTDPTPELII